MKKQSIINSTQKFAEPKASTKSHSQIKFNLSANNLACFKSKDRGLPIPVPTTTNNNICNKPKSDLAKDIKFLSKIKLKSGGINISHISPHNNDNENLSTWRNRTLSCRSTFNQKVVIMEYDNNDIYVDNSRKKSNSKQKQKSNKICDQFENEGKLAKQEERAQDQIVKVCVQAITQQTDNTSCVNNIPNLNNLTSRSSSSAQFQVQFDGYAPENYYLYPQNYLEPYSPYTYSETNHPNSQQYHLNYAYNYGLFYQQPKPTRNRQSVSIQQSKRFIIQYQNIEADGRTTIMIKNIPNKYTQQTLLQQFSINYSNKFDFFYLPIDKDNDCNVGYAFVNFINTSYLKDFYQEFHMNIWKKYNSSKICHICYARYQGTLQLADHFKHTKIINQKDKKVRPLMGITQASKIKNLKQIIKNQRNQQ